jgi:hypothetical protein
MFKIIAQLLALFVLLLVHLGSVGVQQLDRQPSRFRNCISRIVLFGSALALAVLAVAVLPERASAQTALFATSKNLCIGVPDPINNDPNTCSYAPIVGVNQPVFYVIKVTNPPGSLPQQITLTENSPGSSTGYPTGFVPGAIVCTDQSSGATITVAINGPTIGPFNLPLDTTVTCTIAGTFNTTASGQQPINTVNVNNDTTQQTSSVQTHVASTTQLTTDLSVTKSVSPMSIDVTVNPQIVTYTVTINRNNVGPNTLNFGQWFKLHDTLALLPGSVSLYATLITTPGSFSCNSTAGTACLDPAGPVPSPPGQQLIGTMAPHSIFDWGFAPGTGNIALNGMITLKFQVKIEKLPNLSCVKSLTSNGLNNQVFFTLTDVASGTAANDSNNANNTASTPLKVKLAGTVDPNCGAGQLTMTKTGPPNPVAWGGPPWPPTGTGTVTYDITIKNTSMPAQTITIPGTQLQDFVVEGIGTPPFTRTFVSATCILSNPATICTGFNAGGGSPPPPAPFPSQATQFPYTFYGQSHLGWRSNPASPLVLAHGDSVTIRIAFNYYGPDCETVPNVTPKLIDNKAQIIYMGTVVGAASGSVQNVQYTQTAIAHTQMQQQSPCQFVVTKKLISPNQNVQFLVPLEYIVTFTNNGASRSVGTVMDSVRITNPAYATQLPFTSGGGACSWTGNSAQPPSVPNVSGTAIYTNSPSQGAPVFRFTNLLFPQNSTLTCHVKIEVQRPAFNNPNCSMLPAYFENLALMDVTNPYNPNVPWPQSSTYVAGALSNPSPQNTNWATVDSLLPKCYNATVYKSASVNGITPAWTSPSGPPVNYTIKVTNTGTSGVLTGAPFGPSPGWNGLRVEDAVANPYNNNLITGANCVPGPWCVLLKPGAIPASSPSPSYAGIQSLAALTPPGIWNLTLQPQPLFTAGTYIHNCAVVKPAGTFTGPDYYPNYDPANPPAPSCVDVPVVNTGDLSVSKTIVNATGHTINIGPNTFDVNATCQPLPLQSPVKLTFPVGALTLPNGAGVSLSTMPVLHNVPISLSPAETCTVTESAMVPLGACGPGEIAYWDTTFSPAQTMAVTAGPNAVAVTNTLRCKPLCVLDPGMLLGTNTNVRRATLAQTFTPTQSGSLTQITHGLQSTAGGVSNYVLLVTTTTVGLPSWTGGPIPLPPTLPANVLWAKIGVTNFVVGMVNAVVQIPAGQQPHLTAGTQYALILVPGAPINGTMAWGGNSGAGSYLSGSAYELIGTTWTAPTSGPKDQVFKLDGLCP